jgi:hypothetical protein
MDQLFKDTAVGTEVFVYVYKSALDEIILTSDPKYEPDSYKIPAIILAHSGSGLTDTTIGVQFGGEHPKNYCIGFSSDWEKLGITWAHIYGGGCKCEVIGSPSSIGRVEAPCKQCKRPNDKGVKSCWWCAADYPC